MILLITAKGIKTPSSHSFIYSKFQEKKKKIQEIVRYTFRDGVRKLRHSPAIGGKSFEVSDTELGKQTENNQMKDFFAE